MGRQAVADFQPDFSGGLNIVSDPAALRPDQARDLTNYRLATYGAAAKRGGTKQMSAALPGGTDIPSSGAWWPRQRKFVVVAGANLYTAGSVVPVTWTAVSAASGHMNQAGGLSEFSGVSGIDTMYIADGDVVGLKSLNSSGTFTNGITSTPPVNGLAVYNQRLWAWFTSQNGATFGAPPNALFYSNLANAAGSIGGNSLGVGASGGGQINIQTCAQSPLVTCVVIGASLIIFQWQGISRLTGFGQDTISVDPQPLSADFAIVGPNAVAVHQGIGWAVGRQGLYTVTEGSIQPVGTPQSPDPLPLVLAQVSPALGVADVACVYNAQTNEVWVQVPSVGTYAYHTILGAWSGPWNGPFVSPNGNTFMGFPGDLSGSGNPTPYIVLFPGTVPGIPLQCDQALNRDFIHSDGTSGTAWTSNIQCHRMYGNSANMLGTAIPTRNVSKSWRWANIMAALTIGATLPTCTQASMIGGASTTTFGTITGVQQMFYQQGGAAYGPWIDVTITDTSDQPSQYASVDVQGFVLGQR